MSASQESRAAEVNKQERIAQAAGSEYADLAGYCEHCQAAYRISWTMYYKAAKSIYAQDILNHNLNIRTRHTKWNNVDQPEVFHYYRHNKKILEQSLAVYSHDWKDYLFILGIQTILQKKPHKELCKDAMIEVDIPIRKNAHNDVRRQADKAILDIWQTAQIVYPNGVTIVDQRESEAIIETRVKVLIGRAHGIPREPDWQRKITFNHGLSKSARAQLRYEIDLDSEEEEEARKEANTASVPISTEGMELDSDQEALKPIAIRSTKEAPPVAMQPRAGKAPETSSSSYNTSRPRRTTVPVATRYETSNERILMRRSSERSQDRQPQIAEPGPSRQHRRKHVDRDKTAAQQIAEQYREAERDGNEWI